jgi:hypothetical protein
MLERIAANSIAAPEGSCLTYGGVPCRIWTGPRNGSGYGHLGVRRQRGERKGTVKYLLVHRLIARLVLGVSRLGGRVVKHLCNNYLCCEAAHLKVGTQKSNVQQCVRDGRHYSPWRKIAAQIDATFDPNPVVPDDDPVLSYISIENRETPNV